jgi:hypothetical protein
MDLLYFVIFAMYSRYVSSGYSQKLRTFVPNIYADYAFAVLFGCTMTIHTLSRNIVQKERLLHHCYKCALATICLHHSWAQYPVPFEPKVVSCPEYPTGDMYTPLRCLVSDFLLILHTNNKLQTVSLWINAFVSVRIILRLVEYSKGLGSSNSRQVPFHSNTGGYSSYCMLK